MVLGRQRLLHHFNLTLSPLPLLFNLCPTGTTPHLVTQVQVWCPQEQRERTVPVSSLGQQQLDQPPDG
jgi:hypothetical protein